MWSFKWQNYAYIHVCIITYYQADKYFSRCFYPADVSIFSFCQAVSGAWFNGQRMSIINCTWSVLLTFVFLHILCQKWNSILIYRKKNLIIWLGLIRFYWFLIHKHLHKIVVAFSLLLSLKLLRYVNQLKNKLVELLIIYWYIVCI